METSSDDKTDIQYRQQSLSQNCVASKWTTRRSWKS
jgi:hypothetical protein